MNIQYYYTAVALVWNGSSMYFEIDKIVTTMAKQYKVESALSVLFTRWTLIV